MPNLQYFHWWASHWASFISCHLSSLKVNLLQRACWVSRSFRHLKVQGSEDRVASHHCGLLVQEDFLDCCTQLLPSFASVDWWHKNTFLDWYPSTSTVCMNKVPLCYVHSGMFPCRHDSPKDNQQINASLAILYKPCAQTDTVPPIFPFSSMASWR